MRGKEALVRSLSYSSTVLSYFRGHPVPGTGTSSRVLFYVLSAMTGFMTIGT